MSDIYWRTVLGRAERFAALYRGPLFHGLFCDPPYHLTTITDRYGKDGSAPSVYGSDGLYQRASKGFMGQEWDGGDIAFRPETWAAFGELLFPGGFGIAFSSSRTVHRMAVAIEDAGFIIHPMIYLWVYGSGFPKATRIDRKVHPSIQEDWEGHRYGSQAMKPAVEPIIVFQKPYRGKPRHSMVATGAGALNIDAARIGSGVERPLRVQHGGKNNAIFFPVSGMAEGTTQTGRWPANFMLVHSPGCYISGYTNGESYAINRFEDGAKPFGDGAGHDYQSEDVSLKLPIWQCVDGCPAQKIDEQSGVSKSGLMTPDHSVHSQWGYAGGDRDKPTLTDTYADEGGASRYFFQAGWGYEIEEGLLNVDEVTYQSKAPGSEKNAGVENFEGPEVHNAHDTCAICKGVIFQNKERPNACNCEEPERVPNRVKGNFHPTVKPISLTRHLASLLLPPQLYAPRRIFVPFAGSGSEMIGAFQAGWDVIVGVEATPDYIPLNRQRLEYWMKQGHQLELF